MEGINRGVSAQTSSDHPTTDVVAELCFCDKDLTIEFLNLILPLDVKSKGLFYRSRFPKIKELDFNLFLNLMNTAMKKYEINTCMRKAHFLAQISCEGGQFRTTEEYKNKDGSTPSYWNDYGGGGAKYHGRGLIQLTHDKNYAAYAKAIGDEIL